MGPSPWGGVVIFAWIGAAVVGLAMGVLGSGGSILTIPILIYLLGHGEKQAITESFVIVGAIALFSSLPYAVRRRVKWRYVLLFGVPGMIGSYGGQVVAVYAPSALQLVVLALLIGVAAYKMLFPKEVAEDDKRPKPTMASIGVDGLLVGLVTAFAGVGGGFMVVPVLALRCRLPMRSAIGTALFIVALKSIAGFAKAVDQGYELEWGVIAIFVGISMMGSAAGVLMAPKINHRALKKTFGCFLVLMALFIGVKEGAKLISGDEDVEQGAGQALHPLPMGEEMFARSVDEVREHDGSEPLR
jgi:uncharacterized protein